MMRIFLLRLLLLLTLMPIQADSLSPDRYIINADLPAGIVQDVTVTDTLPRGLIYRNNSLNITGAYDCNEQLSGPSDGRSEMVMTWSFGRVNNTGNKDIQISFEAVVADVPWNHAGVTLHPNKASLNWRDSDGLHSSSDGALPVEIVEPDLIIEKRLSPDRCMAGGNISCLISVCHSSKSSSDAFDAELTECLPSGLVYMPESMKILTGPDGILDASNPSMLRWHFDSIDNLWNAASPILLEYSATARESGPHSTTSSIIWTSASGDSSYERAYSVQTEISIAVEEMKHSLSIAKASTSQAHPGCLINYSIVYDNNGPAAHNVFITEIYDGNTTFLSANPSPDIGRDDIWTLGDLEQGASGKIELSLQIKPLAKQGTWIDNIVKIASDESNATSEAKTIVTENQTVLSINATPSSDFIRPGGSLNYTITFRNDGPGEARNISITDTVDSHLKITGSTPAPTRIWLDNEGAHLFWSSDALNTGTMNQGESGEIRLSVSLPAVPEHPNIDSLYNIYRIDSDNAEGKQGSLETFVIHSLFVRKRADRDECADGESVNFTIIYGNELGIEAKSAVVTDRLEGMEYIYAVPAPKIKGNILTWKLGTLPPHTEGSIRLCVRVKGRAEIHMQDTQSISGEGYVASSQKLSASIKPEEIVNIADITATYKKKHESDEDSAQIKLVELPGAGIESFEKGSGRYEMDRTIDYNSGKSLTFNKEVRAIYIPAKISLAQNNLTINSLWEERTRAENKARNEAITENYWYLSHLDNKQSFLMDKNQTVFTSHSESGPGLAQIGYRRAAPGSSRDPLGISENYYGSFSIENSLDSYGVSSVYSRSSSGTGFVSSEEQASSCNSTIRSNEHGSGLYESTETITNDPASLKSMNLSYASYNWSAGSLRTVYASKWSESMSGVNSESKSKIGEKISSADNVQIKALMDSSSLAMTSEFNGLGSIWASVENYSITREDMFAGRFRLDAAVGVYSLPKHFGPHLSLTAEALRLDSGIVLFRINVTNDGDKALAPVEITDILPENMIFFNSSYRPTISGRNINWSLITLEPGMTRTLDLRAKLIGSLKENRVKAIGHYNDNIVFAEASCSAFFQPSKVWQLSQNNATENWCALPECSENCFRTTEDGGDNSDFGDEVLCRSCA